MTEKEVICPLAKEGKCPEPYVDCKHRGKHLSTFGCDWAPEENSCHSGPCVPVEPEPLKEQPSHRIMCYGPMCSLFDAEEPGWCFECGFKAGVQVERARIKAIIKNRADISDYGSDQIMLLGLLDEIEGKEGGK